MVPGAEYYDGASPEDYIKPRVDSNGVIFYYTSWAHLWEQGKRYGGTTEYANLGLNINSGGDLTKGKLMDKLVSIFLQDAAGVFRTKDKGIGDDTIYKRFSTNLDLGAFGNQTIELADFEIEVSDDTFPSQFKLEFYYREEPDNDMGECPKMNMKGQFYFLKIKRK